MPRLAPNRAEFDDERWGDWTEVCAEKISELQPNEFLIIPVDDDENVFVQMAKATYKESCSLLVEAGLGARESDELSLTLLELGWEPPGSYGEPGDGSPNYQVMWSAQNLHGLMSEDDAWEAARLVALTLRAPLAITDPFALSVGRGTFD